MVTLHKKGDPSEVASASFPQNVEEFDADPRVSFSKLDQKFILEADDGQEYEYDDALKRWVPVVRLYPPITTYSVEGLHAILSPYTFTPFLLEWACSNASLRALVALTVGRCFIREAKRSVCRPRSG